MQCFACVGLEQAEFCILNESLPRKAYFSRVAELRGALEERIAAGWRPPWDVDDAPEPEQQDEDEDGDAVQQGAAPEQDRGSEPEVQLDPHADGLADEAPGVDPLVGGRPPSRPAQVAPSEGTGRGTQPWTFADVDRDRDRKSRARMPTPTIDELSVHRVESGPDTVPDPPPYGLDHGADPVRSEPPAAPRSRDRYGWSEQADGTPERMGWSSAPTDLPERDQLDSRPDDLDRRRRETAASPEAMSDGHDEGFGSFEDLGPVEADPLLADRGLEPWPLPDPLPRSRLGPEEQTEPDAPVSRRRSSRHGLSGAAAPPTGEVVAAPPRGWDDVPDDRVAPWSGPSTPADEPEARAEPSLGRPRRPERPRGPEPRDRGTALLRGRAPARPQPTATRQPDAPSLRRARRPARKNPRDETPTAPFPAADSGPIESS